MGVLKEPDMWRKPMILLEGVPKTLEILSCERQALYYRIRFKHTSKRYLYEERKVTIIGQCTDIDPLKYRIYLHGKERVDIVRLKSYPIQNRTYYRVWYTDEMLAELDDSMIQVMKRTADDRRAWQTFMYLQKVAEANPLHMDKADESLLYKHYQQVKTIEKGSAAEAYLKGHSTSTNTPTNRMIIYPYGCNTHQKRAIDKALTQQISVIQGPPGTGKTQVILNIVANILMRQQTVLIVSSSNYAIDNIQERLEKKGLSPWVAKMGKAEFVNRFFEDPPRLPQDIASWRMESGVVKQMENTLTNTLQILTTVYELQISQAQLKQEIDTVSLEWKHFQIEQHVSLLEHDPLLLLPSSLLHNWIVSITSWQDEDRLRRQFLTILKTYIRYIWTRAQICSNKIRYPSDMQADEFIIKLQAAFYQKRLQELRQQFGEVTKQLSFYDVSNLEMIREHHSNMLLKHRLAYLWRDINPTMQETHSITRNTYTDRYPIVLSTTFSARNCYPDRLYDYVIMDEASQISIETGVLSLTCAKNAVIVGDNLQLPNVLTEEQTTKLAAIRKDFDIEDVYDCSRYSLLRSLSLAIPTLEPTLLREHYRCHPKIINFCNQKFYDGKLIIMTKDNGQSEALQLYYTVKGNHAVDKQNQREVDVVQNEILPQLGSSGDIGIITPYNHQVELFKEVLPTIETSTVHKFQGREKDCIIFSTVLNQINPFVDDPKLLNVAISRAKKVFVMVTSGNEQKYHGNIGDLVEYIRYTNCIIKQSETTSIYDYLYAQYAMELNAIGSQLSHFSLFLSENLTHKLIIDVIRSDPRLYSLQVLSNYPLNRLFKPLQKLSKEENIYLSRPGTHVDFLIYNRIYKSPILGIETDGYAFHNKNTKQYQKDRMKDHIFQENQVHLLRLSTKGSGEKQRIVKELYNILYNDKTYTS